MGHFAISNKKTDEEFFHNSFLLYAQNGYLGNPSGADAYGYGRVSDDAQAGEDRAGLPRQIENIHIAALRNGLRISWDNFFLDDETGFVLERPALQSLIAECKSRPKARYVVIEHLDRLSRNADWHQGYLLEIFRDHCKVQIVFWDEIRSRIERVVKGSISQEGMERSKQIMQDGKIRKAKRHNVTATRACFGMKRVDPEGKVSYRTRRETHYAPLWEGDPESPNGCTRYGEAKIVEEIFQRLAGMEITTRQLALELQAKYGPPGDAKRWDSSYVSQIVSRSVYKGLYISNRYYQVVTREIQPNGTIKKTRKTYERPESEWITFPVPAIVSEELWEQANRALAINKQTGLRNTKNDDYLLTGLLRCSECNYAWNAIRLKNANASSGIVYYRCTSIIHRKIRAEYGVVCSQTNSLQASFLEEAVWSIVNQIITHPETLLQYVDDQYFGDGNKRIQEQIDYLTKRKSELAKTDENNRKIVDLGGYTPEEYVVMRKDYLKQLQDIDQEIVKLNAQVISEEKMNAQKQYIIELSERAKKARFDREVPREVKRAMIKKYVHTIWINSNEGYIHIAGMMGDHYYELPAGKDGFVRMSSRQHSHYINSLLQYSMLYSLPYKKIRSFSLTASPQGNSNSIGLASVSVLSSIS